MADSMENDYVCLFCPHSAVSLHDMMLHMKSVHSFDFAAVILSLPDYYARIKAINFIRRRTSMHDAVDDIVTLLQSPSSYADETYLTPVLADDSLIMKAIDDDDDDDDDDEFDVAAVDDDVDDDDDTTENIRDELVRLSLQKRAVQSESTDNAMTTNVRLQNQVDAQRETIKDMAATIKRLMDATASSSTRSRRRRHGCTDRNSDDDSSSGSASASSSDGDSSSDSGSEEKQGNGRPPISSKTRRRRRRRERNVDSGYFAGYSDRYIHELMLKDTIRTSAYQSFIESNAASLFKDKVVLDVGCGTGILSLFAARAGARRVFAVDAADIADQAKHIVKVNGFSSVITVLKGKMESVDIPEQVDVIISEWMGYFLLYESMLPTVIYARDKFLKPQATNASRIAGVYPNVATMYICGIECSEYRSNKIDYWSNVYGFDMSILVDERERLGGSSVETVNAKQVISESAVIKRIDCTTADCAQLDFDCAFTMKTTANASLDAFAVYFTTDFDSGTGVSPVTLSTAPGAPNTHWMQSVFRLYQRIECSAETTTIAGRLSARRMPKSPRAYAVDIAYWAVTNLVEGQHYVQQFTIE